MGSLTNVRFNLDGNSVYNQHISGDPTKRIDCDKVQMFDTVSTDFGIDADGTPVDKVTIRYVARGVGTIRGFHALLADCGTATSVTFDLKKNGTSVLSAPISITNAGTDYAKVDATLASGAAASLDVDDVLTMHLDVVTTATGAKGPYCWCTLDEFNTPAE